MNTQFKPLIWSGALVMIILSVFLLVGTNQILNTATTTNTVSFSGEGKVTAKPDIALISAAIITQAIDSKTAQDQNSQKSKVVSDFLKGQKMEDRDIKTTSYTINPQYKYLSNVISPPIIIGYQVIQLLEIKLRDLSKIGTILDGLVTAGANSVNNLGLQIENPNTLKAEARVKAITDAKKKANELMGQVGISLGKIVNFSENTGGYPMPMMYETKAMGMGGSVIPNIPTGENEIIVNVNLTYQIK